MDLEHLRIALVKRSGRRDLVQTVDDDLYVDNGANDYLNEAQRALDRALPEHPAGPARFLATLDAGEYVVRFQDCRVVDSVWVTNADKTQTRLYPKSLNWLRGEYETDLSAIESGTPLYYAVTPVRLAPEQAELDADDLETAGLDDGSDLQFAGDELVYSSIVVLPPPEESVTVAVFGRFYDRALTDDEGLSWWSVNHPELLVRAACRLLEVDQRNSQGVQDWQAWIAEQVQGIYFDAIDQQEANYGSSQMDA